MRILVISDIHGNQAALETVFNAAKGEYDRVWCLGDIVGYGPRPNECVAMVREMAEISVIGNHDWAVLDRPGISVDDFNPVARHAVLWTREQLTAENRAYLEQLPEQPVAPSYAPDFLVTHASPREPVWEYILTPGIALLNFAAFTELVCLVGHTHKPAAFRWRLQVVTTGEETRQTATVNHLLPEVGKEFSLDVSERQRLILNPGSVGQPRDSDPRAAYAILDLERMSWKQERIAYPIELTQSQMRAANLPRRLIDRLSYGW
jgi:predicted phosphodiesterase